MPKHRTYSIEFKRQVVQEYLRGETLHGLAKRHDVSRNLIRVWIAKYEAGEFDEEADLLQQYEARIAALEIEFLKGARKNTAPPKNERTLVIVGPSACRSPGDIT